MHFKQLSAGFVLCLVSVLGFAAMAQGTSTKKSNKTITFQQARAYFEEAFPLDIAAYESTQEATTNSRATIARVAQLYRRACNANYLPACTNLGNLYNRNEIAEARRLGGDERVALSIPFFVKACSGGELHGCWRLGFAYRNGMGVPFSMERAIEFHTRACNGGVERACDDLAQINGDQVFRSGREGRSRPTRPSDVQLATAGSGVDASPSALTNPKPRSVSFHSSPSFTEYQNKTVRCNFASTGAKDLSARGNVFSGMDNTTIKTKYSYWFGENAKLIQERMNSGVYPSNDADREKLELSYAKDFEAPILAAEKGEISGVVAERKLVELVQSWMRGC